MNKTDVKKASKADIKYPYPSGMKERNDIFRFNKKLRNKKSMLVKSASLTKLKYIR
jgi:hypothetical protein